jgi:hypothetical protein
MPFKSHCWPLFYRYVTTQTQSICFVWVDDQGLASLNKPPRQSCARPKSGVVGARFIVFELHGPLHLALTNTMSAPICSRVLLQASRTNGLRGAFSNGRRGMADVAGGDMTLPLKGLKVLDMTRVLAGVS